MIIALDTNVFISALDKNQPNYKIAALLLNEIRKGKDIGLASSVTFAEIYDSNNLKNKIDINNFFKAIINIKTIPADDGICKNASQLRQDSTKTLKVPDALHLATSITHRSDLFITDDDTLRKIAIKYIETINLEQWHNKFYK
jgi:predicted nucleic acid-binding protein